MKLAIRGGDPVRTRPFPAWPVWGQEEAAALMRVLESGKWGSLQGDEVSKFERAFAAFQDAEHAVACSSGTTAIEIALRAAGIRVGDEVIVPAYTFVATATAVLMNGAIPVFVDVERDTYNIDPRAVEAAITERTRAIIPVHFAGRPADMDALSQVAYRHNLYVIEDAAQAWGAKWRGRSVGAFGDLGCFSFQSSKNINAGEGGIIVTDQEELANMARSYSNCGRVEGGVWYAHYFLGGNYRMTEFQAAVLSAQLQRFPQQLVLRQQNMEYLDKALSEIPGILPMKKDVRINSHAGHIYVFRFVREQFDYLQKADFIKGLQAEGIPCSGGYSLPLYEQPIFQSKAFGPFSKMLEERVSYNGMHLENTHRACYDEAIWLRQSMLLDEPTGMRSIVDAVAKIYENRHELL